MNTTDILQVQYPGRKGGARGVENQDRIFVRTWEQGGGLMTLLGVADGVTNCPFGGSVARWVADKLLQPEYAPDLAGDAGAAIASMLVGIYREFQTEFADNADMLDSACTLSVAWMRPGALACAWVGDSPIFLLTPAAKGFHGEMLSRPDVDRTTRKLTDCFGRHAPGQFKSVVRPCSPGAVVVVASDGGQLDEASLAHTLHKSGFSRKWLDSLLEPVRKQPVYDDISVVACIAR